MARQDDDGSTPREDDVEVEELDEEVKDAEEDSEPDPEELVDDLAEDLGDDDDDDDDVDVEDEDEDEDDDDEADVATTRTKRRSEDDEDEDEDLLSPDDVEADLDRILKDRMVTADDEEEDEDEEAEPDERGEATDRLQPKRPDEQLCPNCFLLVRAAAPGCPVGDDACPIFTRDSVT